MNRLELPKASIFDADGTLWDVSGIRHYVTPPHSNFHAFHMASIFCPPNLEVVEKVHEAVERGLVPILVTARMAKYRQVTQRWLERHEIPITSIWMRGNGDFRKDAIVKREILGRIRLWYDPVEATDDNPAVIEVWEDEGLVTHVVPGWNSHLGGKP